MINNEQRIKLIEEIGNVINEKRKMISIIKEEMEELEIIHGGLKDYEGINSRAEKVKELEKKKR